MQDDVFLTEIVSINEQVVILSTFNLLSKLSSNAVKNIMKSLKTF
ncbi:hypothetical protein PHG01_01490 [Streptococcus mutans PKUSS-HG01]|nr:hypothetical protein PLG01_01468 [Streptococcus mutans PKUSS-LG01]ESS16895.1 hypothetical protein PHG01_01490 [Streptococcus mutans PKUSS-HG01]